MEDIKESRVGKRNKKYFLQFVYELLGIECVCLLRSRDNLDVDDRDFWYNGVLNFRILFLDLLSQKCGVEYKWRQW